MKIPKQISHPLIIACASATLLYIMWLNSPSEAQVKEASQQIMTAPVPDATAYKKDILTQNNLHQIEDVLPGGLVLFTDTPGQWQLEHDRFKKMTAEQAQKIKDFFVGKFVKVADLNGAKQLALPLELFSPYCFSNTDSAELQSQCPVVLQP